MHSIHQLTRSTTLLSTGLTTHFCKCNLSSVFTHLKIQWLQSDWVGGVYFLAITIFKKHCWVRGTLPSFDQTSHSSHHFEIGFSCHVTRWLERKHRRTTLTRPGDYKDIWSFFHDGQGSWATRQTEACWTVPKKSTLNFHSVFWWSLNTTWAVYLYSAYSSVEYNVCVQSMSESYQKYVLISRKKRFHAVYTVFGPVQGIFLAT